MSGFQPSLASASFSSLTSTTSSSSSGTPTPANPLQTFDSVFSSAASASLESAHDVSRSARSEVEGNKATAGYGEFRADTLMSIIELIKEKRYGLSASVSPCTDTVIDLGSGSGRGLFAACLAHPFKTATGLEYMPALHASALANLALFTGHSSPPPAPTNFIFSLSDITKLPSWRLTPSPTLLLCHATLFDNDLFACVQLVAEECDPGTLFVVVSKELRTGYRTGIETLHSERMEMTWGTGTVYIQRRVLPD